MKHHGNDSVLAKAIGRDIKGKVSLAIYAVAIPLAFVNEWVSVITKFDGLIFTLRDGDSNQPTVNSVQTLYRWAAIRSAGA